MQSPAPITKHQAPSTSLTIHTDGGSRGNPGPAATGVVILDPQGHLVHEFGRFMGQATNNEAEYAAVIDALNWVSAMKQSSDQAIKLNFKLDSKLVVEQVTGHWKIKEPRLQTLNVEIQTLITKHQAPITFSYIPRAQNAAADKQVNLALDAQK